MTNMRAVLPRVTTIALLLLTTALWRQLRSHTKPNVSAT